jgi:hypothetical protein
MFESTMPTFFGRATAVLGEHAHLHMTVDELRDLCRSLDDSADDGPSLADPRALLERFADELFSHFLAEEKGGYFDTLVAERPHFGQRVSRLLDEHDEMRRTTARLTTAARSLPPRMLAARLAELIATFEAHERDEVRLLQDFFSSDEGAGG